MTLGVAAVAGVLVGGFYYYVSNRGTLASAKGPANEEQVADASGGSPSKYLEAAGVRIFEEDKRPRLRFLLVNHSSADLADLKGSVAIVLKDGGKEVGTMPLALDQLRAFDAKEIEGPLKTSLRAYELPDWQFVRAEIQLKE